MDNNKVLLTTVSFPILLLHTLHGHAVIVYIATFKPRPRSPSGLVHQPVTPPTLPKLAVKHSPNEAQHTPIRRQPAASAVGFRVVRPLIKIVMCGRRNGQGISLLKRSLNIFALLWRNAVFSILTLVSVCVLGNRQSSLPFCLWRGWKRNCHEISPTMARCVVHFGVSDRRH
jgi:hypothetical protein